MDIEGILRLRAEDKCEVCSNTNELYVYQVEPAEMAVSEAQLLACRNCCEAFESSASGSLEAEKWKGLLSQSINSEYVPVQIMSWRMLQKFSSQSWSQELLAEMSLDELSLEWAKAH